MDQLMTSDRRRSREAAARYALTEHLRTGSRWVALRRRIAIALLPPGDRVVCGVAALHT